MKVLRGSLMLLMFVGFATISFGQIVKAPNSVRLTGSVLDADQGKTLPYVNVRVKGTMYGTSTDNNGYFTIFISAGDTLSFSAIGYRDATFIMPYEVSSEQYSLMQLMREETVLLSEVVIFPWPSIESFHKAFMDTKPKRNMDDLIFEVKRDLDKDVKENEESKYYYDQMRYNHLYQISGQMPPNNFLNPMRWADFLRDINDQKKSDK